MLEFDRTRGDDLLPASIVAPPTTPASAAPTPAETTDSDDSDVEEVLATPSGTLQQQQQANTGAAGAVHRLAEAVHYQQRRDQHPRTLLGASSLERELIHKLLSVPPPDKDASPFITFDKYILSDGPAGAAIVEGCWDSMKLVYDAGRAEYCRRMDLDPRAGRDLQSLLAPVQGRCTLCNPAPEPSAEERAMSPEGRAALARAQEQEERKQWVPLFQTTFLCTHRFCANCLVLGMINTPGLFRCPGCSAPPQQIEAPTPAFIPPSAHGLVDPMLINHAKYFCSSEAVNVPGRAPALLALQQRLCGPTCKQLSSFFEARPHKSRLSPDQRQAADSFASLRCHACSAPVEPILGGAWGRCTSGMCSALCCLFPAPHPAHLLSPDGGCSAALLGSVPPQDAALLVGPGSKPCPKCGTPNAHFYGHGCHHVTCTNDACLEDGDGPTHFCWICGKVFYDSLRNRYLNCSCDKEGKWFCFTRPDGETCGCLPCPDCPRGCKQCGGDCPVCKAAARSLHQ